MPLAKATKTIRKKLQLLQENFTKKLNVSVGSINRWENRKTKPNLTAMKAIKSFCKENEMNYQLIEKEQLGCLEEDK